MKAQRGVALLAAVLVVALAAVLVAAVLDRSEAAQARTRNALRAEQGWQLMGGLEGWAIAALRRDAEQDGIDSHDDAWAQELPPIDLPGVRIVGRLRELSGCFNLNNLYSNRDVDGGVNERALDQFRRLLVALKLDEAIADQARDWIDPDSQPESRGAEDMRLLTQRPPYRAANRHFVHVSELRLLPAVTAEVYKVLAPQVCALPLPAPPLRYTQINLNTATPELWMSLDAEQRITPNVAAQLWREGHARFMSLEDIRREIETQLILPERTFPLSPDDFSIASEWFVLEAEIQSDGIPFLYSALLHRAPGNSRIVARWRGRY